MTEASGNGKGQVTQVADPKQVHERLGSGLAC